MTQPDPRFHGGYPPNPAPDDPYSPGPVLGPVPPGPSLGGPPPPPGPSFATPPAGGPVNPFGEPASGNPPPRAEQVVPVPLPPRGPRVWPKVVGAVAAVVVLAGLVFGSYVLVRSTSDNQPAASHHRRGGSTAPTASPSPTRSPLDVSSRTTDSKPLTVGEVFPDSDINPDPGRDATYHVLKTDKVRTKCPQAATGGVGAVLTKYGCNQVVRATMTAPVDGYVLTAGMCNLENSGGAQTAADSITDLGKKTKGSFAGFAAPGAAAKLDRSPTVYALQAYGHYILYVVIGKTNGKAPAGDATTQQIVTDIVQTYLTGIVDHRRDRQ